MFTANLRGAAGKNGVFAFRTPTRGLREGVRKCGKPRLADPPPPRKFAVTALFYVVVKGGSPALTAKAALSQR